MSSQISSLNTMRHFGLPHPDFPRWARRKKRGGVFMIQSRRDYTFIEFVFYETIHPVRLRLPLRNENPPRPSDTPPMDGMKFNSGFNPVGITRL
jgi:hypothetical protein